MRKGALVVAASLMLAGCVSPYLIAKTGRIGGSVVTMWVGADKFVYVPGGEGKNFAFETASTGRVIAPGLMYTDGGSIPRIAQIFNGLSPWGFGPAYIVHDWIFYGRNCYVDQEPAIYNDVVRFDDVNGKDGSKPIEFDESALILAEVIKTLVDYGQVREQVLAAEIISSGVDSPIAAGLWKQTGELRRTPRHPIPYRGGLAKQLRRKRNAAKDMEIVGMGKGRSAQGISPRLAAYQVLESAAAAARQKAQVAG